MATTSLRAGSLIRNTPAFKVFAPAYHLCRKSRHVTMATASASDWLKQDERRMLHAVYRVGNMDETIEYYKKHFGLKQLRYRDIPEEKYSNAFLGAGPETDHFALELTYNYGVDSYDIGTGFGHFALAHPDVYALVDSIKKGGGKVSRDAGPVKGGQTVIAFVDDPTGYKWELIQRPEPIPEPIAQVMLRVTDLDRSIQYYTEALGMKLLRKRDNPEGKYTLAFMAYGPENENTVIELTYNWGKTEYENFHGNAYAQVAISTKDVYKSAEQIKAAGGKITREPGPLPGINTKIMATTDPDGWKYVLVDEEDFLNELK
ncbi:probable lactoylglutathione lyase [Coccomyxa sp. Obi]|nr:probable lactoylglutathione lyase [Coccomyxa sp. Obi]